MPEAQLIDGRAIAGQILEESAQRAQGLIARGIVPGLVFIRVGEDPASKVYVGMKEQASAKLGIASQTIVLPATTSEAELLRRIHDLNRDRSVHGILVQAPLPPPSVSERVYASVSPRKDVDGFHPENVGRLMLGERDGFRPCTPAGVLELLVRSEVEIPGSHVVILGRGNIVGKPMAAMLIQKDVHADATVTLCHSRTRDLTDHTRRADILIAAMGVPRFVTAAMVKPGAVVIDVGVNRIADPSAKSGTRLVGDVDFEAVRQIAGKITPNPGGVGPMTIAMLMRNTVRAAELAGAG
ncbi:MAG: bifunctional 5,10-methylenetetrahydrofolate dehydrogenase/5,10-methenyltetrahydrofolate cyclohydrolase [Verrucomicrobia bacterium]|nr:bifunctional 5,10-methylenetetrahydrofolate dehydrogenase/5,10-methenyltetrahydrofolate cyclohydrolase [Verrucomicrobiota bacterium]